MSEKPIPSFEELAAELSPQLTAYLARMTGSATDADDLLQETLMRVARALPGFEGRSFAARLCQGIPSVCWVEPRLSLGGSPRERCLRRSSSSLSSTSLSGTGRSARSSWATPCQFRSI